MFLRGLRWSKVKICVTTTIYTHTGGLIRLYIVIWSVLSQFKWLLLFLHHAWRGHGARLSIRTKDPNNHSDTETGTLSTFSRKPYYETRNESFSSLSVAFYAIWDNLWGSGYEAPFEAENSFRAEFSGNFLPSRSYKGEKKRGLRRQTKAGKVST